MLTNDDVLWIKGNRTEITQNRTTAITLAFTVQGAVDEWTGEVTETRNTIEVDAVVTEISTGVDRDLFAGVEVEKGDIQVAINIDDVGANDTDDLDVITYDGKDYAVLAVDKKGIGVDNRYEVLGREVS